MSTAEIYLPYYKQGDDMANHLASSNSVAEALEAHATRMEAVANQLRAIEKLVVGQPVKIDASTHFIGISGPDEVIDKLIAGRLATAPEFEDDEDLPFSDCPTP